MPVDRWMVFHIHVTMNFRLTGQTDILAFIAENLDTQQRMNPLPHPLQKTFLAAVFGTVSDDHIAAAALSPAHAVEKSVRPGIQLDSIMTSYRPNIFSVWRVHGDLFIDEVDLWHGQDFNDSRFWTVYSF